MSVTFLQLTLMSEQYMVRTKYALIKCFLPGRLVVVKFWKVKSYMQIFSCTGVRVPNPHIIQGSTVHKKMLMIDELL